MYDMIIVGAGPAGSVLAKGLGQKYKVLLLDKRKLTGDPLDRNAEKCCGGLLDPSAQKALASLHIGIPKQILVSPQVFTIRAMDFDNHRERYYQKQYVNIDRVAFDRYLISQAHREPGVSVLEETVLMDCHETRGMVQIKVMHKPTGTVRYISGRYLIGADGAASAVRRLKTKSHTSVWNSPREYVCLQQWFTMKEELPYFVASFDRYITDFYSWMIPKDGRVILGSAIPKGPDARLKFTYLKAQMIGAGFDLGEPVYESGAVLLRPWPFGSIDSGNDRILLIGEAAGLISPCSAEGISYAIRSAVCLLHAFFGHTGEAVQDAYERRLMGLKANICLKSCKSPVMYNPMLRGLVFQSRLLSMKTEDIGAFKS